MSAAWPAMGQGKVHPVKVSGLADVWLSSRLRSVLACAGDEPVQLVEISRGDLPPLQQLLSVAGASASLPPLVQVRHHSEAWSGTCCIAAADSLASSNAL